MGKLGKEALALLGTLMQTPLAEVIEVMQSGEFSPSPKEAVKKEEIVIGGLTDSEKATATVCNRLASKANIIATTNDKMVNAAHAAGADIDKAKVIENKIAHRKVSATIEAFDHLFLASIINRFGKELADNCIIGVRKGYQLVRLPRKKCCGVHVIHISRG